MLFYKMKIVTKFLQIENVTDKRQLHILKFLLTFEVLLKRYIYIISISAYKSNDFIKTWEAFREYD